ncbi:MAG: N-acetylmuramoyl-L-alanine amidase [Bacteroides sp.]|nr:N-acetylmuramoyl-L-alanine amidase [Bacteroides sp.]
MRKIDYLIIHCSATRADRDYPVVQLLGDHLRRGFRGIGYHYYVQKDGTVHCTRPLEQPGAHCLGHNRHSIGICYEGGLDKNGRPCDTRTPEQRSALRLLVYQLLKDFHNARVCGHRDLSTDRDGDGIVEPEEWTKHCPCFDVASEL